MGTAKGERFITIFIGRFNKTRKSLEYINAGHNPPVFYNMKTQELSVLKNGCVGLGMIDDIPMMNIGSLRITDPSKLICYTDGLVEFTEKGKVIYNTGIVDKFISNDDSVNQNVNQIVQTRTDEQNSKAIGIFDDISILGFEFR
jgi:sigma-B regulation protein RsbU (phosphoserine phosphatase)